MLENTDLLLEELNRRFTESQDSINEIKSVIQDRQEEKNKRAGIYGPATEIENRELDEEISAKTSELQNAENQKNGYENEINQLNTYINDYKSADELISRLTQSNVDLNKELEGLELEKFNENPDYIKQELFGDLKKIKDEIERNSKEIESLKKKQIDIEAFVNGKVKGYGLDLTKNDVPDVTEEIKEKNVDNNKVEDNTKDMNQEVEKADGEEKSADTDDDKNKKTEELKQIKDSIEELNEKYKQSRELINKYRKDGNEDAALKEEENAEKLLIQKDELKKKKDEIQSEIAEAEAKNENNKNEENTNASSNAVKPIVEKSVNTPVTNNVKATNSSVKKGRDIKSFFKKLQVFFIDKWHVVKKKVVQLGNKLKTKLLSDKNVKAIDAPSGTQNQNNTYKAENGFKDSIKVDEKTDLKTEIKDKEKYDSEQALSGNNFDEKDVLKDSIDNTLER